MSPRRTVITGLGLITAAGTGGDAVWESLRRNQPGLRPLTLFPSPRYDHLLIGQVTDDVDQLAGPVRGSRSDKLAWIAAREALQHAGLPLAGRNRRARRSVEHQPRTARRSVPTPDRLGVVLGATVGGMLGTEQLVRELLHHQPARFGALRHHECASAASRIARQLGARGPVFTFSTACSAGALALAAGTELIANNEADVVLAGGCDGLCRLTVNGFGSLLLLDPHGCRPFDAGRTGISLGEGAAVLVLEAAETAAARGAPILAELSGWGATCDAHHATAPRADGLGAFAAMHRAIEHANLSPADISYVNAHGTGTPDNDLMEGRALRRLFMDRVPPVSSTQRFFGHTLGASGAIKAALCVLALEHQAIPPNPGFTTPDPAIGIEPVREFHTATLRHILSNSFGFGGNNVSLVFSQHHPLAPPLRVTPRPDPLAIVGVGVVSPSGHTLAEVLAAAARPAAPAPIAYDLPALLSGGFRSRLAPLAERGRPRHRMSGPGEGPSASASQGSVTVHACSPFNPEACLTPARRRRLSRLQQMTLVAAKHAAPAALLNQFRATNVCVAIGTGFGSANDTARFTENLIAKDEREPLPQHFTNSVHNALAGQVAIELDCQGLNSTPIGYEISFETALWHAAGQLRSGAAQLALVGAADELNPYAIAAARRWHLPGCPGEGAVVVALTSARSGTDNLGRLHAVVTGHIPGRLDAEAEAQWIQTAVEHAGLSLAALDVLVIGNAAGPDQDGGSCAVAAALNRRAGRSIRAQSYQQVCGEFPAASALGFLVALGMIADPAAGARNGLAAVYTLSRGGLKALCLVGR